MVVLPALSRPSTRIRASESPNRESNLESHSPCDREASARAGTERQAQARPGLEDTHNSTYHMDARRAMARSTSNHYR